eukprot:6801274-Pyramimonas_sp.AAC.1
MVGRRHPLQLHVRCSGACARAFGVLRASQIKLKNGVRIPVPKPTLRRAPTRRKDRMTLERTERIRLSGLEEELEE